MSSDIISENNKTNDSTEEVRESIARTLDETRDNIRKSIDESRKIYLIILTLLTNSKRKALILQKKLQKIILIFKKKS